jgi:hypothetical protein
MRSRACVIGCLLICSVAGSAAAQERPAFAGRWTTEVPAAPDQRAGAPRARDMGSGWGPTITIAQDARTLTVEYAFFARGDMQRPLRFVYALDGTETRHTVMMGRGAQQQTARTAWRGDSLVITTRHIFPHPETGANTHGEVTRVLYLAPPDSLVVHTTIAGVLGGPPSTARTVYRRAQ